MARTSLFEKMEKEHQILLEKIDELDEMVTKTLKEWGLPAEGGTPDSAGKKPAEKKTD